MDINKVDTESNNIKMNVTQPAQVKFSRKFKILLWVMIILTFMLSFGGSSVALPSDWNEVVRNDFVNEALLYASMFFLFITFITIAITKKPFSNILVGCIYAIGILFIITGVIVHYFPGYIQPHLVIMEYGGFFIDGNIFSIGLVMMLFGRIMKYGFEYQKEVDTII